MKINPLLLIDGYKADHRRQYPEGTELVYSNWTPRKSRVEGVGSVVFFGLQYFIQEYLIARFNEDFFDRPIGEVCDEYKAFMDSYLGNNAVTVDHIAELHSLGYLPLAISAVPEGTLVPIGVPMLTIYNTDPKFFWLTNQLETLMSSVLWTPCTSATTAHSYRNRFVQFQHPVKPACDVRFQGHDFSFRGMSSPESAMTSGAGHLLSFYGTDTIPAIKFVEKYYPGDNGLIGCSVPATEHSVMCMGGQYEEVDTYRRLLNEVYPSGIVSIVSDTWDFWKLLTEGMCELKEDILNRWEKTGGCCVIRPDSGDPVKIICGDKDAPEGSPERLGAFEVLYRIFGGDPECESPDGLRVLHPSVGLIYGDSITEERQLKILQGLVAKNFEPTVVLGIGSYTYQHVTRDTYGFAMKATYGQVITPDGLMAREIYKSPKTDPSGEKKSAKGLLQVIRRDGKLTLRDQVSWTEALYHSQLTPVFWNGDVLRTSSFADVRSTLYPKGF